MTYQDGPSGIYVDASHLHSTNVAGIGIVLLIDGAIVEKHKRFLPVCSSAKYAEREAVRWAQEIYPGSVIHTDCIDATINELTQIISRKENSLAHGLARRAAKQRLESPTNPEEGAVDVLPKPPKEYSILRAFKRMNSPKRKKFKRFVGRGCRLAG